MFALETRNKLLRYRFVGLSVSIKKRIVMQSDSDIQVIHFKKELEVDSESESEVHVEEEQKVEPWIISVEEQHVQVSSCHADKRVKNSEDFSSHPWKKKAKVLEPCEEIQIPQITMKNVAVKVEPSEPASAAPCEGRRSRALVKSEPPARGAGELSAGGELSAVGQLLASLQRPVDDDEVFGAHVASELRALRRPHLKRRLRRLVQEAILSVAREDDDDLPA